MHGIDIEPPPGRPENVLPPPSEMMRICIVPEACVSDWKDPVTTPAPLPKGGGTDAENDRLATEGAEPAWKFAEPLVSVCRQPESAKPTVSEVSESPVTVNEIVLPWEVVPVQLPATEPGVAVGSTVGTVAP